MGRHKQLDEAGFTLGHIAIGLGLVVTIVIAVMLITRVDSSDIPAQSSRAISDKTVPIKWTFNDKLGRWTVPGAVPPNCTEPIITNSPLDTTKATAKLFPGQYRGGDYKPHGGFSFDTSRSSDIQVVMPMNAKLTGMSRYIEGNEVQYLLSFETDCGIAFRFDHLYTLSPAFQRIANTLPVPKPDDSREKFISPAVSFKAGVVVATAIGHPATNNIGMDFGVYDYRKPNDISKNATWAALHQKNKPLDWYGVCWFDMLPSADKVRTNALPSRDQKSKNISDYCKSGSGTTLSVNAGRPI